MGAALALVSYRAAQRDDHRTPRAFGWFAAWTLLRDLGENDTTPDVDPDERRAHVTTGRMAESGLVYGLSHALCRGISGDGTAHSRDHRGGICAQRHLATIPILGRR